MSYSLIVIDMQQYFGVQENTSVSNNVAREIRKAIADDASIIFVEYTGCGATITQLQDVVKQAGASKVFTVYKSVDDGSEQIIAFLDKNNLDKKHIKVVGVNTDCCVYRTVSGLKYLLPKSKIEVIADACDSNWDPNAHTRGIQNIRSLGCLVTNGERLLHDREIIRSIGDPI